MLIEKYTLDIEASQFPFMINTYKGDKGFQYRFDIKQNGIIVAPGQFGIISSAKMKYVRPDKTTGSVDCLIGSTGLPTQEIAFVLTNNITSVPGIVECVITMEHTASGVDYITSTAPFLINVREIN